MSFEDFPKPHLSQAKPTSTQLILKLTLMSHDIAIYETAFPSPLPATWFWLPYPTSSVWSPNLIFFLLVFLFLTYLVLT